MKGRSRISLALLTSLLVVATLGTAADKKPTLPDLQTRLEQLEARATAADAKVAALELRLANQEDVEKVRILAFTYGYYMDNAMYDQVFSLFSTHIKSCEIGGYGVFNGHEGCKRLWRDGMGSSYGGAAGHLNFGKLAKHYLIKDIITVAADGKSATGRFDYQGWGSTFGDPASTHNQLGVYNFDFAKEDGIWKITRFQLNFDTNRWNFSTLTTDPMIRCPTPGVVGDAPATFNHPFPETGITHFREPNPVTGKAIPDYLTPTRYFRGNWPGEWGGPCGKRPDFKPPEKK